jgi:hypothetical protein
MPIQYIDNDPLRNNTIAPNERSQTQPVIDAVCLELGLTTRERARRKAVAERVTAAFRRSNLPLNLVTAGLQEPR